MTEGARRGLSPIWLVLVVVGLVLVPYLFWQGTWFGRRLADEKLAEYLVKTDKPRHVQHALSQIADAIIRGDSSASRWYPQVVALAASPTPEVRVTVAWVMGQDTRNAQFHEALARLLADPEPMVRRNAALSLVRFHDARGKAVLFEMLRPYTVAAPRAGTFAPRLKEGDSAAVGTLLARIEPESNAAGAEPIEVRSRVPGTVKRRLREKGARVAQGDPIIELSAAADQAWEALRALYLIGSRDDLAAIAPFLRPLPEMPERVRQQAEATAQAIRSRP